MVDLRAVGVGLILILIVVAIIYITRRKMPTGGETPNVSAEIYLYYDPSASSPTLAQAKTLARGYQGVVATPGDVSYYAALGGVAGWCGIVSTGDVYSVPGELYAPGAKLCCREAPHGVWIRGPKILAGKSHVSPFNSKFWYQPAMN